MKSYLRKILPPSVILWTHKLRGFLAASFYGNPSKNLKIIGVTGTNGKTTTCNMIATILEKANYKTALATTINFKIGTHETVNKTKMTMVSPFALQKFLREAVRGGCHYAVVETTSHAIAQFRNYGIKYEIAVLTNVTHDHLDYHKTYEEYRNTKAKMFSSGESINIVNVDDKSAKYFADLPAKNVITYGLENPDKGHLRKPEILGKKILLEPTGSLFTVVTPIGQIAYELKLPGKFNVYNALAAISVAVALNIHLDVTKQALDNIEVIPGRMERIDLGQSFTVLVDYAHTPDALEKIYQTLVLSRHARIIAVFGATGDRDKSKRPIMGAIAGHYADIVIVTNEDPYTEDAVKIIEEVASGVNRGDDPKNPKVPNKNFFKELDRRKAIKMAIDMAYKDDIVIITGKGAEEVMVVGEEKIPFSDRKIAKEYLLKRINN